MNNKKVIGIMQPYFFPYIGYWQLLNAVDEYVIYDDVNYIKGGWINRNRILLNDEIKYINLPMLGASPNKLINQVYVNRNPKEINHTLNLIKSAYRNAPYFDSIFPLIEEIMSCDEEVLSSFLTNSIYKICNFLEIDTKIVISSSLKKNCLLKGEEKVISICHELEGTDYLNAIGGRNLYSFSDFAKEGLNLHFMRTGNIEYSRMNNAFESNLSIIDILMFNPLDDVKRMLNDYTIIENEE